MKTTPKRGRKRSSTSHSFPHDLLEKHCRGLGHLWVAGVDEVGRGCLAGPVVAAAVILSPDAIPEGINDSKKLTRPQRESLDQSIRQRAVAWAVGFASVEEIDTLNILQASRLAMLRAVEALNPAPHILLVDGRDTIDWTGPQQAVIGGDATSVSIAAASILAKVHRDRWMAELDTTYPGYDFASNKGYGSRTHRIHLQNVGPSPVHRKSFHWTPV